MQEPRSAASLAHGSLLLTGLLPRLWRLSPVLPRLLHRLGAHHLRRDRTGPVQPLCLTQQQQQQPRRQVCDSSVASSSWSWLAFPTEGGRILTRTPNAAGKPWEALWPLALSRGSLSALASRPPLAPVALLAQGAAAGCRTAWVSPGAAGSASGYVAWLKGEHGSPCRGPPCPEACCPSPPAWPGSATGAHTPPHLPLGRRLPVRSRAVCTLLLFPLRPGHSCALGELLSAAVGGSLPGTSCCCWALPRGSVDHPRLGFGGAKGNFRLPERSDPWAGNPHVPNSQAEEGWPEWKGAAPSLFPRAPEQPLLPAKAAGGAACPPVASSPPLSVLGVALWSTSRRSPPAPLAAPRWSGRASAVLLPRKPPSLPPPSSTPSCRGMSPAAPPPLPATPSPSPPRSASALPAWTSKCGGLAWQVCPSCLWNSTLFLLLLDLCPPPCSLAAQPAVGSRLPSTEPLTAFRGLGRSALRLDHSRGVSGQEKGAGSWQLLPLPPLLSLKPCVGQGLWREHGLPQDQHPGGIHEPLPGALRYV